MFFIMKKTVKKVHRTSRPILPFWAAKFYALFGTFFTNVLVIPYWFCKTTLVAFLQKVHYGYFTSFTKHYFAKTCKDPNFEYFGKWPHSRAGKKHVFLTILSILSQSSHVPAGKTLEKHFPYLGGKFIDKKKTPPLN